MTRNIENINK